MHVLLILGAVIVLYFYIKNKVFRNGLNNMAKDMSNKVVEKSNEGKNK